MTWIKTHWAEEYIVAAEEKVCETVKSV